MSQPSNMGHSTRRYVCAYCRADRDCRFYGRRWLCDECAHGHLAEPLAGSPSDSRVADALDMFTPQTLAEAMVRISDERDRYRDALRVIAEGEYASESHAADYARRALNRSVALPSLGQKDGPA